MRDKLIELIKEADSIAAQGIKEGKLHTDGQSWAVFGDHLIANGVTVQEWISVEDMLPEDIDTYLVVVKYKYDFEKDFNYATDAATYNPYENAYIDDCWCTFNDWDEGQQYLHITHWMPLPEPPKGE